MISSSALEMYEGYTRTITRRGRSLTILDESDKGAILCLTNWIVSDDYGVKFAISEHRAKRARGVVR